MSNSNPPILIPTLEPIKVLAMVLQEEMGLDSNHILLGLENFPLPEDVGLFVSLRYGPDQVIGNNQYNALNDSGDYSEIQDTVMLHFIDVEVLSFDSSARLQKQAVLQAIQSYYAQSLMENYQMRLASTPGSFTPVPSPEPSKQLNRFAITIGVNAIYRKIKVTPFYETLQTVDLIENP